MSKGAFAKKVGIARVSYDRLETQLNPPHSKTIRKFAKAIGIPYIDARRLVYPNQSDFEDFDETDETEDQPEKTCDEQLGELREAARLTGRTLGDMLVVSGLTTREELAITF